MRHTFQGSVRSMRRTEGSRSELSNQYDGNVNLDAAGPVSPTGLCYAKRAQGNQGELHESRVS